ncbi:DJ-1/PfpI family protein [Flavobacterium algicola]|uniref:DJ-1/PfpI family protein n=1 Tax=Flavobacterium algicola TaxID=556529 RepID=UPI001EFE7568|nr:DJ-1/PfpI family protein [Flavobacterium algicola]MCG9791002.1 DJ-1/PfpI family protein [Flavobacterium algicola]
MKKIMMSFALMLLVASCNNKKEETVKPVKSHEQLMAEMYPEPKVPIKTVGILLYDNYAVLDAMGPFHVFNALMGVKVFFVGRKKGIITTMNGMKVECEKSIDDVKQLDILVIPGGMNETYALTKDTVLLNWIKEIDKTSKYTASVCTGAWILAATGLLNGKEATTHWYGKKLLKDKFNINVVNRRYTNSGKYWTSAGVSAGIDMSLAIVRDIAGDNYTKIVMLDLEYDPKPPIEGGSEHNTDSDIVEMVREMYDSLFLPYIKKSDEKQLSN